MGRLTYIGQQCITRLRMEMSKDLVAASATPLVLAILAEGDSYGYAIIKRVAELSGGHLQWTDGMLYPVLHRLERQGHVAAKWSRSESGRRRKYYRITKEGRAQLEAQREQWRAVDGTLRGIWMQAAQYDDHLRRSAARGADRAVAGLPTPPAGPSRCRRRGARRTSARGTGGSHRGWPRRGRSVPGRGEAHGQPRCSVARVRTRAFRAAVEAVGHHPRRRR